MRMKNKPMLDHYSAHDAIPVRHSLTPVEYARVRTRLYSRLGLSRNCFTDADILEFGPGTGENAAIISHFSPTSITLVDANPRSLEQLQQRMNAGDFATREVTIIDSNILDFDSDNQHDIVLCEGVIPGQLDPHSFLQHVASFVRPGGQLVITTSSEFGYLADACRRLIKPVMHAKYGLDQEDFRQRCADLFAPQLAFLGSPKLPLDWVIDGFLLEWPDQFCFSIEESIDCIGMDFDVVGTSPSFISDWSWFKRNRDERDIVNQLAIEGYRQRRGYLIDDRVSPKQSPAFGDREPEVTAAVDAFMALGSEIHRLNRLDAFDEALGLLTQIEVALPSDFDITRTGLSDFKRGFKTILDGTDPESVDWASSGHWWGRGLQYASFTRIGS